MANFKKLPLAASSAALCVAAHAAPVVLQNPYVQAGVNDVGTLGSGDATTLGILFDPTGLSAYGVNDFLTPGTPFEGFYITAAGGFSWFSNNEGLQTNFNSAALTGGGLAASWTGSGHSGLTVQHSYSLGVNSAGRATIAVETTLTNNGNAAFVDLAFLRTLDPDPDSTTFSVFDTVNTLVSPTQVCATGSSTGQTICLLNTTTGANARAGISTDWSENPAVYLAGINDGDGDNAIGLAYNLSTLNVGASTTFRYEYATGASIGVVTSVPEPSSLALIGLSLLGLGASARHQRNAAKAQ